LKLGAVALPGEGQQFDPVGDGAEGPCEIMGDARADEGDEINRGVLHRRFRGKDG